MIVVLVGTSPYTFKRVIKVIDELAGKNQWQVFIQLGHTDYQPKHCDFQSFIPKSEIMEKIKIAEVVICHGGFGSIRDALACDKLPVVVPRLERYNECLHEQDELMRPLASKGRIIPVYDLDTLENSIEQARGKKPARGDDNKVPGLIQNFLNNL